MRWSPNHFGIQLHPTEAHHQARELHRAAAVLAIPLGERRIQIAIAALLVLAFP